MLRARKPFFVGAALPRSPFFCHPELRYPENQIYSAFFSPFNVLCNILINKNVRKIDSTNIFENRDEGVCLNVVVFLESIYINCYFEAISIIFFSCNAFIRKYGTHIRNLHEVTNSHARSLKL